MLFIDFERSASVLLELLSFDKHIVQLLDEFRNELLDGLGHRVGSVRLRLGQTSHLAQDAPNAFLGSHGEENHFCSPIHLS